MRTCPVASEKVEERPQPRSCNSKTEHQRRVREIARRRRELTLEPQPGRGR